MLASVDVHDQNDFEDWNPQWGMDDIGSDDDFHEQEMPEFSPENHWKQIDAEVEDSGNVNRQDEGRHRETKSCNNACVDKSDDLEEGNREVREPEQVDTMPPQTDLGQTQEIQTSGPKSKEPVLEAVIGPSRNNGCNEVQMGHSLVARSKSLDLNENPKLLSPGVQTWIPRSKVNISPSPSVLSTPSINQAQPSNSLNSSQEIEATMELGEKIGFRFEGNKDQAKKLLKKQGADNSHQ
ncbi:hypothetical protein L2E82_22851 [Cichorium intybus]|uniref:Uncharacterized protein n=1 Tax=Cichorium intybus TaxID=13427 RepID=A0ACB9DZ72_CICIN|nr:hypothetical protein L2E82_22851 [Cichorium intybus]